MEPGIWDINYVYHYRLISKFYDVERCNLCGNKPPIDSPLCYFHIYVYYIRKGLREANKNLLSRYTFHSSELI